MTNEPSHHPSVPIQKILIQFFLTFADSSSSSSMPRLQPFAVGQVFNESLYQQVHVLFIFNNYDFILFLFHKKNRYTSWAPQQHHSSSSSNNNQNGSSRASPPSSPPRPPSSRAGPSHSRRNETESRDLYHIMKSALQSNCSDTLSYLVTCYMYMYSGELDVVHAINVIDYIPCVPG